MSNTATASQISFYTVLVTRAAAFDPALAEVASVALEAFPKRTVADASEAISRAQATLLRLQAAAPAPVVAAAPTATIPDGSYALDGADGKLRFYDVRTPSKGKWQGFTFVDVAASDERYPIKGEARKAVLAAIAADPRAAAKAWADEFRVCSVCHRQLTDEVSRSRGMGNTCYSKHYA